jgi:hypothetical protein
MENTKNKQFDNEIVQMVELILGKKMHEVDDDCWNLMVGLMRRTLNLAYTKGKIDCHRDYHNDYLKNKNIEPNRSY